MLQKLRKRLTWTCTVATAVVLCMMAGVSLFVSERDFAHSEQETFQGRVNNLVLYLSGNSVVDGAYLARYEVGNRLLIYLEDNGRPLLFQSSWGGEKREELRGRLADTPAYTQTLQAWRGELSPTQGRLYLQINDPEGLAYRVGICELSGDGTGLRLYVFGDMAAQRAGIFRRRLVFVCAVAMGIALLALFSWWFSGRAIEPVAGAQRRQAEFVAAVSHELRTPLSAIGSSVEAMGIARESRDRERFTSIIERECRRATQLVGDMLTLASIDSQGWSLMRGPVETGELLQEILEIFQTAGVEKEIQWTLQLPENPPVVNGDGNRLRQVLAILLDNAVRYTPAGGTIAVGLECTGRRAHLFVADSGPGMTEAQKAEAFTRFYRGDRSRTDRDHYGLGLSIAWELVRAHGGRLLLEDTPGGGLTAHVIL